MSSKGHIGKALDVAIWFGLLTGVIEACLLGAKTFILGRPLYLSRHFFWMVPLADVVIFVIIALLLVVSRKVFQRIDFLFLASFVYFCLFLLSIFYLYPRLYDYALLLLALGIAVQAARYVSAHNDGFYWLVRKTSKCLLGFVLVMALVAVWQQRKLYAEAEDIFSSSSKQLPNVLLIVLDTVRAQSLSLYEYNRMTTPNLTVFAKKGTVFDQAISTAPWTLPSHASMFTGRIPAELSVDWVTPFADKYATLAEVFSQANYRTAGFVANLLYCTYEFGLNRGFGNYEDFEVSFKEVFRSSSLARRLLNAQWLRGLVGYYDVLWRKNAARINERFLQWLSLNKKRPFFVFLNYYDAHTPYLPPEPFASKFARKRRILEGWNGSFRTWLPEEIFSEQDAYDGAIAYLDHHLGLLFAELERRKVLQNTLVIVTADHGEEFGEHGVMSHGNSLYLPSLRVPLLMVFPERVPAGTRVREPVSLRDLSATILDIVQLKSKYSFPGNSLAGHWTRPERSSREREEALISEGTAESDAPSWYPASKGDMKALLSFPYHYIKNGDGREELYNIESDPEQTKDLGGSHESSSLIKVFREKLETILFEAKR